MAWSLLPSEAKIVCAPSANWGVSRNIDNATSSSLWGAKINISTNYTFCERCYHFGRHLEKATRAYLSLFKCWRICYTIRVSCNAVVKTGSNEPIVLARCANLAVNRYPPCCNERTMLWPSTATMRSFVIRTQTTNNNNCYDALRRPIAFRCFVWKASFSATSYWISSRICAVVLS